MLSSRILSGGFLAATCLCTSVQAQIANRIGFTAGWNTSFIDRIGGTTAVGDCLQHFDDRDYLDWMLDPADLTGANFLWTGMVTGVQDQIANTAETFTMVSYDEDPATPNFPNPAGPAVRSGAVNLPPPPVGYPNPAGPIAWNFTLTWTAPIAPRPKGDKWIGLGLPQPLVGTWPTDGLSVPCAFDSPPVAPGTNQIDRVGPGIIGVGGIPVGNLSCFITTLGGIPTSPALYPAGSAGLRRQIMVDILANVTGGVVVTQTNQARYTSSNPGVANPLVPLGGTTNMLSGQNPDTIDANASTPARADDVGFLVTDVNFANQPLFLFQAFGPSPVGSLHTTVFNTLASPTSKGNVCIDFISPDASMTIAFLNAAGRYQHLIAIPPSVRANIALLRPIPVWYQAFVLNTAAGVNAPWELHATGCAIQHL